MRRNSKTVLHLFSSDHRPLYLKDCLDVLALPTGAVHRFRYARQYVWTGVDSRSEVDAAWSNLAKIHREVLIHFVGAKTRRYGDDVFIPLRWGKVVRSFAQGDYLFVDFEVGSYADPLTFRMAENESAAHAAGAFSRDSTQRFSDARAEWGRGVTASVRQALDGRFPSGSGSVEPAYGEFSAVVGPQPVSAGKVGNDAQSAAFARIVSVMDDLVGVNAADGTIQGSVLAFFRIIGVRTNAGGVVMRKAPLSLRAAKRYQLEVLHLNPAGFGPDSLSVTAPEPLLPAGDMTAVAAGRYDVIPFEFGVKPKEDSAFGKLTVANQPPEGAKQGTQISISVPFKAKPRKAFIAMSWFIAVGTTLAAFLLALNSMRAVAVITPADPTQYVDLSGIVTWVLPDGYLALSAGAIIPAIATALVAGLVAVGAVFRRRWGLSSGNSA